MNILEFGFEMCFFEQALVVVVVEVAAAALCLRMSANDQTASHPFPFAVAANALNLMEIASLRNVIRRHVPPRAICKQTWVSSRPIAR